MFRTTWLWLSLLISVSQFAYAIFPQTACVLELTRGLTRPAERVLDRFTLDSIRSVNDLHKLQGTAVYRVALGRERPDGEMVWGVLRVAATKPVAEYEAWCSDLICDAPGVVVSPVRILPSTPRFENIMREQLLADAPYGLRMDHSNLLQRLKDGHVDFWVTLTLFLPGESGFNYLDSRVGLQIRRQIARGAQGIGGVFESPPWNTVEGKRAMLNHKMSEIRMPSDPDLAAYVARDLRRFMKTPPPASVSPTEVVRQVFSEAGHQEDPDLSSLFGLNVFTSMPPLVQKRLAHLWAAAYLAGVDDLHASNWLIHQDQVFGIDLNHSTRIWARGEVEPSSVSPVGGDIPLGRELIREMISLLTPEFREWLGQIADGRRSVDYGLSMTEQTERGVRDRARWLLRDGL